jgi:hypothetical protein
VVDSLTRPGPAAVRRVLIGAAAFALALALLLVMRSQSSPHPPYPRADAERAAMRSPDVAATLKANSWTDAHVIALDETHWRVTFTDGPRALLDAAVGPDGAVDAFEQRLPGSTPPGSSVLWTPALLVLLAFLFVVAVGVRPLRSLRNLDAVVAAGGFTLAALLYDARLVGPQIYVGVACLVYLAARCGQVGLGGEAAAAAPAEPLYQWLFQPARAPRLLRLVAAATLVAGVVMTVTSTGISDVAFASLAGATKLVHGQLPYGNLTTDVVHGDTYPLVNYVLYIPFAAVRPVRDSFDDADGALWLNAIALVATAVVLYRLAGGREAGTATALAWLAFPPVLLAASAGTNDVPTAFLVAAALALFARPALSAGALALAGLTKVVPSVALLVWLARLRGRPLAITCAAVAAALIAVIASLLVVGGSSAPGDSWHALRFQFERGSWSSIWQQTGTRWLQPVFQAGTVGLAAVAANEVWRRGPDGIDMRRAAALAGAIIALLQISANYWTYMYLPWLVPFILVALLLPGAAASPPTRRRSRRLARSAP